MSAAEARALARQHLDPALPGRWRHVQGVAARGAEIAARLGLADDVLARAAWLHDIGYGPNSGSPRTRRRCKTGARNADWAIWR